MTSVVKTPLSWRATSRGMKKTNLYLVRCNFTRVEPMVVCHSAGTTISNSTLLIQALTVFSIQ